MRAARRWNEGGEAVDELAMLIKGELDLSFWSSTARPSVGEEVLIPADTPHTVRMWAAPRVAGTTATGATSRRPATGPIGPGRGSRQRRRAFYHSPRFPSPA
jgi:hypothetical protein